MDKKFYTKDVQIYEQIKTLEYELNELRDKRHFIDGNYDSEIHTKIEASSLHNFNDKKYKKVELPINIILGVDITKSFVLQQIDKRIEEILEQLALLNHQFDKRHKSRKRSGGTSNV